jgi:ketol-acid reductoisomerase
MKTYHDSDANLSLLRDKKIAIVGYGSQGRAQALNLRDSGMRVRVGLPARSKTIARAVAEKMDVTSVAEVTAWADIVMLLAPDELQAEIYKRDIAPHIKPGASLAFGHGFNVHYGFIKPQKDIDVWEVAPKDTGAKMRSEYARGHGVPCLVAVHQNKTGKAFELALAYGAAIGAGRAGMTKTTFREECEVDLFGEQAVFFGGLVPLMRTAFETMVEAGYPPEMAYFRCVQQVRLVTDAICEHGIAGMQKIISNTAEYGGYIAGPRLITKDTKKEMKRLLKDIQNGAFAHQWMKENKSGGKKFKTLRAKQVQHPLEKPGKKLREKLHNR